MITYCLTLDLIDNDALIAEYEAYHKSVWPEIITSIKNAGIRHMAIYRYGNRLMMTIEADNSFSFAEKAALDARNPKVEAWEQLMWKYQQAVPGAAPGAKWVLMQQIFSLSDY